MTTIVIMPGGFHPFHAGHYALYQSAQRAFPDADVYVAATNDTSARPFPFPVKEKLAKLAGVEPGHFVQVKSPFKAEEITAGFDPARDTLIFVRSEKDSTKPPQAGGVKKDGSPAYLQPLLGAKKLEPFAKHAYMAYLPTVEFGPGMTSATEIRGAWPQLNEKRKTALVMSLYPRTQGNAKLAATVVGLLDAAIGSEQGVVEGLKSEDPEAKTLGKFAYYAITAKGKNEPGNPYPAGTKSNADFDEGYRSAMDNQTRNLLAAPVENLVRFYNVKDRLPLLKQGVAEAFDQPYRSKTEKSESGSFDVLAKLPDGTNLSIMFNNNGNDEWQVEFYRNNSQEVTGEGDAQRIFATVLNAIQKFITKHKPAHLTFAASKETDPTVYYEPGEPQPNPASRAKLYDRLVQRYAKAWGYRAFRADNGHIVMYELSRINKPGVAEGLENFNGIQLSLEIQKDDEFVDDDDTDNQTIFVQATASGRELGQVVFAIDYDDKGMILVPQDLEVDERFRGQGIAATMYDYVKSKGYRIHRSYDQTPAGAGFWDKHKPGKDIWEQGVAEGSPIVVALAPIDVRNPKKAPQPYRNKGDIVPNTKPASTEKRGVKGRPGQRPMPKYDEGMAEAAKKCPPATQDIGINLENRQKAIDEYGYGPLNPDLPNTKFWMLKVDEWNLDSMEEAQQSLCGNCAAFDIRQDTLDCIAQGIDSDSPEDAEGVIDAGELGYCKFLKFKCASRRTCDAWVTGGPLQDKPVDENQGWAATYETNAQNFVGGMTAGYQRRENQPVAEQDLDYIEEKWSAKYKSSINCANPKGFSQKAHCAGRKK